MIGALVLAVVQGVAGDTSAFASAVTTRSPYQAHQVRLELQRPAYVTVLGVWPDSVELAASHGFRLAAGTRYVTWPATSAGTANGATLPAIVGITGSVGRRACDRAAARRGEPPVTVAGPRDDPAAPNGAPPVEPPRPPCSQTEPVSVTRSSSPPTQAAVAAGRVLVIVSESQPDLQALSRAIDRLNAPIPALPSLAASLLAGYRGAWAAYVAEVN